MEKIFTNKGTNIFYRAHYFYVDFKSVIRNPWTQVVKSYSYLKFFVSLKTAYFTLHFRIKNVIFNELTDIILTK